MYFWLFQVSVLETTTGSLAMSWTGLTCRKIWSNNFLWNLYLLKNEGTVRLKRGNLRLGSFCIFPLSRFCALDILASAGNKDTKKLRDRKQEVCLKLFLSKKVLEKRLSHFSLYQRVPTSSPAAEQAFGWNCIASAEAVAVLCQCECT